jgi:hypothetical protein
MKQALQALDLIDKDIEWHDKSPTRKFCNQAAHFLRQAIAEAEKQEPYGYFRYDIKLDAWVQNKESTQGVAFYTSPREWVGLTHIEIGNLWAESQEIYSFAKVIEAKLKEKNT